MAERINEATIELFGKISPLFIGKAGVVVIGFVIFQVDGFMGNV